MVRHYNDLNVKMFANFTTRMYLHSEIMSIYASKLKKGEYSMANKRNKQINQKEEVFQVSIFFSINFLIPFFCASLCLHIKAYHSSRCRHVLACFFFSLYRQETHLFRQTCQRWLFFCMAAQSRWLIRSIIPPLI